MGHIPLQPPEKDHDLIRDSTHSLIVYIQMKSASDQAERKLSTASEYIPGKVTNALDQVDWALSTQ
ncbi:hypothetical protein D9758_017236 [Tetrapyrgos nigripes]|uniref:C2 DOCK-type domain-containing protein n=1 Tax=Tetrapyrgos nigripes TaxID=182062 RepID=A0A8H5C8C9_9AGAR|nr:hypothetical protein D9758_017236 [Tetrapyrgos nigripes]